jgi:hypothetical protein
VAEEDRPQRTASNASVCREINEAIESGQTPISATARAVFRCECGQLGCNELIELTVGAYERVRAHPRRFVIAVGHQQPEIERLVETYEGYSVVEKRDEAGRMADAEDPRS